MPRGGEGSLLPAPTWLKLKSPVPGFVQQGARQKRRQSGRQQSCEGPSSTKYPRGTEDLALTRQESGPETGLLHPGETLEEIRDQLADG